MSRLDLRNIQRVDHNYFHGWHVCFKRRGEVVWEGWVKDGPHGREASRRNAMTLRDRVKEALPPPVKMKRHYSLNRTGTVGVFDTVQRTRSGRRVRYLGATWIELDGQRKKRSFSALKYGVRDARARAKEARRTAEERILAHRGPLPPRR